MILMCGIPGSGKSTKIKNLVKGIKGTYKVVSRDDIRFSMVAEDEPYFSKEKAVFNEFIAQVKTSLIDNDITFVDATHINESSRGKVLRALGSALKNVKITVLVMKVPVELALARNAGRTGRALVPDSAIKNMNSQFSLPTFDEGVDNILIYEYDSQGREIKIREEVR